MDRWTRRIKRRREKRRRKKREETEGRSAWHNHHTHTHTDTRTHIGKDSQNSALTHTSHSSFFSCESTLQLWYSHRHTCIHPPTHGHKKLSCLSLRRLTPFLSLPSHAPVDGAWAAPFMPRRGFLHSTPRCSRSKLSVVARYTATLLHFLFFRLFYHSKPILEQHTR